MKKFTTPKEMSLCFSPTSKFSISKLTFNDDLLEPFLKRTEDQLLLD